VGAEHGELSGHMIQKARGWRLVTVLFMDIVESTAKAAERGNRRWSDLVEPHHTEVQT
jgi:class 3 adenylate cyclase